MAVKLDMPEQTVENMPQGPVLASARQRHRDVVSTPTWNWRPVAVAEDRTHAESSRRPRRIYRKSRDPLNKSTGVVVGKNERGKEGPEQTEP